MDLTPSERSLGFIDALRGVAILMVILVHTSQSIAEVNPIIRMLCEYGQMGVQLFFFLSAYTLCLSIESKTDGNEWIKSFYLRRYFRIAPLYYTGILIYFVTEFILSNTPSIQNIVGTQLIDNERYSIKNVMVNIFFVHNFSIEAQDRVVPGGWSIGVEMLFYFIFPSLFLSLSFLFKRVKVSLFHSVVIAFSIFAICFFSIELLLVRFPHLPVGNNQFGYFSLLNQLPVFVVGMLAYFVKDIRWQPNFAKICFLFVSLSLINILLFHFSFNVTLIPFISAISWIFLFELFKNSPLPKTNILSTIGRLSYSIYLLHFLFAWPLVRIIDYTLKPYMWNPNIILVLGFMVTLTISFGLSKLTYHLIEKPGINFGKSISVKSPT
jgi:peptidoglycan/LPS O-acetylase OafA/YrhL